MLITHPVRAIDLLKGHPNPAYLPASAIAQATQQALSKPHVATPALLYGADEGYQPLRAAVAAWNSDFYGRKVSSDNIVISGGASQNLACILQVLSDPLYTDTIWISSPAYMLVFRIFQDHGFADKLRAVPETANGIDVNWLAERLREADQRQQYSPKSLKPNYSHSKYYRHLLYVVPTFSNPSSSILSLRKRETLVRLARKHDILLVADDVYDHLQWSSGSPSVASDIDLDHAVLPRLVDIDITLDGGPTRDDDFGNAISNGSFSKIVGPGVRCGWTDATTARLAYAVSQAGSTRSGGAPSQLTSAIMTELLVDGWLTRHISTELRPAYAERWMIMASAIEKRLVPLGCELVTPGKVMGGFFLWVKLPGGISGDALALRCKTRFNLIIASGSISEVPGQDRVSHDDHIRLCFTWAERETLVEGIELLASALETLDPPTRASCIGALQDMGRRSP